MPSNNNRINFQVGYNVDQSSVNAVKKSLQDLQNIKVKDFSGTKKDLDDIREVAGQVQSALTQAFNVNLNSLNTQAFNASLKEAGLSVDKIYTQFSKAGAQGQIAFSRLTKEVLTTNMQLKQTNSIISSMGQTMMNTVKWGVASSVMNNFTNSVQQAFQYVKSLDSALTDIRIVTGDSAEQMRSFAQEANNAAQSLGRSTMDYTKAALTFYQQGLSEEDVQARTESVLKAQNITGAGQEMADYLTAVWNGYKVANEEAELYVDKLAAVADSSASNMSQLAVAMSKVASTANTMGVDVDQLNAQIATIVATTRQAPESVGNALKTVYTRINDIATGAEDAQISLGNYSEKMAEVGINVLDANGRLRDTGQVIEEVGSKWAGMSKEQQIYLARTMAGQRQINNMTALFDNWDKYIDLVNVSLDSQGTTMEKNERYMDSLGAKMEQFGAAGERVKAALIDEEDLKDLVDFGTGAVDLFANLIESIGGGGNALLAFGSIFTQLFSNTIAKELNNVITNFQNVRDNAAKIKAQIQATQTFRTAQQNGDANENAAVQLLTRKAQQTQRYYSIMSTGEINAQKARLAELDQAQNSILLWEEKRKKAEQFADKILNVGRGFDILKQNTDAFDTIATKIDSINDAVDTLQLNYKDFITNSSNNFKIIDENSFNKMTSSARQLLRTVQADLGGYTSEAVQKLQTQLDTINTNSSQQEFQKLGTSIKRVLSEISGNTGNLEEVIKKYNQYIAQGIEKTKALQMAIDAVNKNNKQLFDTTQVVKAVSSFGQLASAINSIFNLGKIWTNENLSGGEKLLQTVTSLGMAIPMLVTSFGNLNSALKITNTLKTLFGGITAANTAATEAETAAQYGLNAAMQANPLGMIVMAATAAVVAITGLVAIYDKLHMSLNEATQATQAFKEKQKQLSSNTQSYQQNTSQLEEMKEEYEELARKAGASTFDSTIDNLTEAERSRYNQIKNLIVSYNEEALAGYNNQGQAILTNNSYLEDTIRLLKEKHQAEIDSFVNSDQFRDANKADDVFYQDTKKRKDQAIEKKNNYAINQDYSNAFARAFDITSLATDTQTFEQQINKLVAIQQDGIEKLDSHRAELDQIKDDIIKKAGDTGQYAIQGQSESFKAAIQQIQALGKEYQDSDFEIDNLEKQIEQKSRFAADKLLLSLQATGNNEEYGALAEAYGQSLLNSIITNYSKGLSREDYTFDEAVGSIKQNLLQSLKKINLSKEDISGFQDQFENLLGNTDWDNITANQYAKSVNRLIEKIYSENSKLQQLAKQNPEIVEQLFQSMFGLDNINIDFNKNGDISVKIRDQYTKLATDAKKMVQDLDVGDFKLPLSLEGLEDKKDILKDWIDTADLQTLGNFDHLLAQTDLSASDLAKALDDAKIKIQNLANAYSNADTLDLLGKSIAGQIDDQELSALQAGLEELKNQYGNLTGAVQILNKTWLSGTSAYQKAYEDVKNTIFASFSQVGEYTDQIKQKLSNFAVSMQDLQRISTTNPELVAGDPEWAVEQLEKIASGYQSCTDQLNKYLAAKAQGNIIEEQAARFDLEIAARSQENSRAYDIQAQRISQVAKQFVQYAQAGKEGYEGLNENAQLASDAATRYIRLNDAIVDLSDNFDKYKEVLEEANQFGTESVRSSEQMSGVFDELKESVADLLDTSSQLLGDEWIADNMNNILEAANGNEQALRALQDAAGEEILLNMGVDMSSLDTSTDEILDWINALPDGQIDMTLDSSQYLNQLVWAMQAAGHGQTEIESALRGLGLSVDLTPYEAGLNAAVDQAYRASDAIVSNLGFDAQTKTENQTNTDTNEVFGYDAEPVPMTASVAIPRVQEMVTPFGIIPTFQGVDTGEISFAGISVTPNTDSIDTTKQTTSVALMVKNARKKSGGNLSHSTKNRVNNNGNKGGGNKNKGGGGGKKGSTPKKATIAKTSNKKIDRKQQTAKHDPYQQIDKSLERQGDILDDLQRKEKHLTGKERLKNLQAQNKTLKEQENLLKQRINKNRSISEEGTSAYYANQLAKLGAKFDKDGKLADENALRQSLVSMYDSRMKSIEGTYTKAQNSYNKWIKNVWNKMSGDQQEANKALKDKKDQQLKNAEDTYNEESKAAQELYKKREKLIDEYNKAIQEAKKDEEALMKLQEEFIDNKIAMSQIKVTLSLDAGQLERDWLDFEKKFIKKIKDDDILGNSLYDLKQLQSYIDSGQVMAVNDQITKVREEIKTLEAGAKADIYGGDVGDSYQKRLEEANKRLQQLLKQQQEQLMDMQELVENIEQAYLDSIKQVKDNMDDVVDQYERVNDLVNHNVKLTQLLYGDKAYGTMEKYYNLQKANNERELATLREQQNYWQNLMNNKEVGSDAWKEAKENLDNTTDELNSKLENMIQNLSDQWENRVDGIIAKLNNALTGGRGLDYVDQEWDAINMWDDTFLDPVESRMGINEIQSLYQEVVDGLAGSPGQQQKMNKLMSDQLKLLREKDNLTQYDLDRAKASLEVEKARLALEQARDNKNKMRLRRDSQGNYTYQYVADEQKLSDLQKSLVDAQANLYNMDKEHYKETLNDLYDTYKDYIEKMKDLTAEYNATQDEAERKRIQGRIDLLNQSYSKYYDSVINDSKFNEQQYLAFSTAMGMGLDPGKYTSEQLHQLVDNIVPQAGSQIEKLRETVAGKGGLLASTKDAIAEIANATKDYDADVVNMLSSAGTSLDTIKNVTDQTGKLLDSTVSKAANFVGYYQQVVKVSQDALEGVGKYLEVAQEIMNGLPVAQIVKNLGEAYNTTQVSANSVGQRVEGVFAGSNTVTSSKNMLVHTDNLTAGSNQIVNNQKDSSKIYNDWLQEQNKVSLTKTDQQIGLLNEMVTNQETLNSYLTGKDNDIFNYDRISQNITDQANAYDQSYKEQISNMLREVSSYIGHIDTVENLNQNVNIQASFPNVINHLEIEQAFNELVNIAAQNAARSGN